MNNSSVTVALYLVMRYCMLLMILGFPKFGNSFWPASYRVDLRDHKTFVITAGEDDDDDNEENENEMIRPEDLADVVDLVKDEERYKPLHSHVEHYNRRAAEAAKRYSLSILDGQPSMKETNFMDEEKPFIAGFKQKLDKYNFHRPVKSVNDVTSRKNDFATLSHGEVRDTSVIVEKSLIKDSSSMNEQHRSKRDEDEEDILRLNENTGDDLLESMSPRNHSLVQDGHATPHTINISTTTERTEEYEDEITSISGDRAIFPNDATSRENETTEKSANIYQKFESTTARLGLEENEEEEEDIYDYESLRDEYEQQMNEAKNSKNSYNYTDNGVAEETPKDALKKIVEFDMPRNCSEEELTKFGIKAFECLAFDYTKAKNHSDVRRILTRTWNVIKVWICIYVCIAVPAWCQKGWCCCCFRCSVCFPKKRILIAKDYYAHNEPGILVDQPRQKGAMPEPIEYKPTLFEIDAYEEFESAIRNL